LKNNNNIKRLGANAVRTKTKTKVREREKYRALTSVKCDESQAQWIAPDGTSGKHGGIGKRRGKVASAVVRRYRLVDKFVADICQRRWP